MDARAGSSARGPPAHRAARACRLGPADQPIPLVSALAFLSEAAAREGLPDLGCRVVDSASIADLGVIGHAALAGPTAREGLRRASKVMPSYSTHERFMLHETAGSARVLISFGIPVDAAALHVAHQYTAALVQALCLSGGAGAPFTCVEIPPHPVAGLDHLRRWFGDGLAAAPGRVLAIDIPDAVLDRPLRRPGPELVAGQPAEAHPPISGTAGVGATARLLIGLMLEDGVPTVGDLAETAGVPLRSLQRRLAEEDTSFSAILDEARRDRALAGLAGADRPIVALAADLGYSDQACLTRAVRRWTGSTPGRLRRSGG